MYVIGYCIVVSLVFKCVVGRLTTIITVLDLYVVLPCCIVVVWCVNHHYRTVTVQQQSFAMLSPSCATEMIMIV